MSADFQKLLRVLAAGNVDFIIVGGLAATIHGAARATYDVDVVYARTIQVKRAAGRPKDFEAIAELEAIREERNR